MISIVIPVYNEEANIDKLTESILAALSDMKYEVLFINDGSTDNSEKEIEEKIKVNSHIKLINLRRNYGQTAAMQADLTIQKEKLLFLWMETCKMTLRIYLC